MYYDDEARRFNFVSGLVLGAILGTAIALLAAPRKPYRRRRHLRGSAHAIREGAVRGLDRLRDEAPADRLGDTFAAAREALRRAGR